MTRNLHAITDFERGDKGQVLTNHRATKITDPKAAGGAIVVALQDIKAGMHGWFDDVKQ